jgi:hypothetical protein
LLLPSSQNALADIETAAVAIAAAIINFFILYSPVFI